MGGTFTSWGALEQALQQEVADATREVIDNSMEDLHRNVDRFYGATGGRYMRTGTLRSSPECSFMGGGAVSSGEIRLNTVCLMAKDFRAKVTAELDTAEAEGKLNAFLNQNNKLKIDVELNQDSAKKLSSSIEKGIKQTKIDTSSISKQLAESFNITDKSTISQIRSQLNKMMTSLGKAWDGSNFNVKDSGFSGFAAGMEPLQKTLSENAKLVQGATGIYDDFFNYFKDKKIFVSDALKKELGEDNYKELLQNNVGKIVRDASKGVSIDSIWGEMETLFPEHFAENITTQADQITHAFDLMKKARADMTQVISAQDMDAQTRADVDEFAWKQTGAWKRYF